MKDFLIYSLAGMLSASKRSAYKQGCREQADHLLRFIVDNQLSRTDRNLPPSVADDLVIMASDLTDEGLAVMREGLRKWMAVQDSSNMKILDAALLKVRSSSTGSAGRGVSS